MSQMQTITITAHKSKSNYDAKQKKFKSSLENLKDLINNDKKPDNQRKISKAQTYRLLNCVKVLEYLKNYDIQPCNERICRALKQYGKNKENICKLWEQVLISVNNKKESINSILVKNIWMQMNNKNNYQNNYAQPSYPNNYVNEQMNSYPTPDKTIFIKEFNNNNNNNNNGCTMNYPVNNNNNNNNNNFLPSPECKPMFIENSYNNYSYNNNNTNINNINSNLNSNNYNNETTNSTSSSKDDSSDFCCTYPALYKPAWTISIEQLRNGSKINNNNSQHYPSPTPSPSYYNSNANF